MNSYVETKCPICGSKDVRIEMVSEVSTKRRGFFGWMMWLFLIMCTAGLVIIIPLLTNSKIKTETKKICVCQNCGHSWVIK